MASGYPFSFSGNPLYISTNSGASWTTNTSETWAGMASSADGGALVGVGYASVDPYSAAIYRSQSIQPPLMKANPRGNSLLLSWLVPSTDFALEQSANLSNWSVVTNAPALDMANLRDQVAMPATNGTGFYRLMR
ncbi:MAG: hypothetical protein ACREE6_04390 [Limisphaerales bacterium]